jgi:hypothetical protein
MPFVRDENPVISILLAPSQIGYAQRLILLVPCGPFQGIERLGQDDLHKAVQFPEGVPGSCRGRMVIPVWSREFAIMLT